MTAAKKKIKKHVLPTAEKNRLKKAADKLNQAAMTAKKKYEEADPAARKKIMAGLAAAAVAVTAAIGLKRISRKK